MCIYLSHFRLVAFGGEGEVAEGMVNLSTLTGHKMRSILKKGNACCVYVFYAIFFLLLFRLIFVVAVVVFSSTLFHFIRLCAP